MTDGLSTAMSSWARPSLAIVPGRKLSITMSAQRVSRLATSRPPAVVRSMVIERFEVLNDP